MSIIDRQVGNGMPVTVEMSFEARAAIFIPYRIPSFSAKIYIYGQFEVNSVVVIAAVRIYSQSVEFRC